MTTPQWENLPQPAPGTPLPGAAAWAGFALDPRLPEASGLRASNADRDRARAVLTAARSSGRLGAEEFTERMEATRAATFVGQLAPLIADVVVDPAAERPRRATGAAGRVLGWFPGWWLRLALLFNVIWLVTVIAGAGGGGVPYYWPIWPMLGTAIPGFIKGEFGNRRDQSPQVHSPQVQPQQQLPPGPTDLR